MEITPEQIKELSGKAEAFGAQIDAGEVVDPMPDMAPVEPEETTEAPETNGDAETEPAPPPEGSEPDNEPPPAESGERPIANGERAKFRAQKKAWREEQAQQSAEIKQGLLELQAWKATQAKLAVDIKAGKIDAVLAAQFGEHGINNMSDLTRAHLHGEANVDPVVRKLQIELSEFKDAETQRQTAKAEAEQSAATEKQISDYKGGLAETIGKSEDETLQRMAKEPAFINAVFFHAKQHYEEFGDEEPIDVPELAKKQLTAIRAEYDKIGQLLGVQGAKSLEPNGSGISAGGPPGARVPVQAAPRKRGNKTLDITVPGEVGGPKAELTEDEWIRKYAQKMRDSDELAG